VHGHRKAIEICDVAPRDGLQSESPGLPPAVRAELAARLGRAGVPRVEAASFVRDDLVPQMAGAEEVVSALPDLPGTTWAGLVLNGHGYERLRATSLPEVHVSIGVTEEFQRRNANSSVEEGLATVAAVVAAATRDGRRSAVTVSCAFGCPFTGEVDPGAVYDLAGRCAAAGADEIVLADTIGVATPTQVRSLVDRLRRTLREAVGVHLHDTRGTAVACAWAAVEAGATVLDASVGGVGGCPFAPGAQGNVATEDLVYLLEREGVATGIDLDALVAVARWLGAELGRELPGRVSRAGGWP
jgi:hydroxymethylglutaryl-CoA lyase/(R)-citramalyl-CoA lyase